MTTTVESIEIRHKSRPAGVTDSPSEDSERVVITLKAPTHDSVQAYIISLEMLTAAFRCQLQPVPEETISTIVSLCVPKKPVTSTLLREAKMLVQAKTEILHSNDWITAHEIAELAQFKSSNPSSQPNKWKLSGKIFALRHEGVDYFPIYGLDPAHGFRPFARLGSVISTLASMKDGWGMAFWFASPNGYLGGKRPKDLLQSDPQGVLEAAEDEVAGVIHG